MKIADLKNTGWLIGHNPDPAMPIPHRRTPAMALLRGFDQEGRALLEAGGNLAPAVHYRTAGPGEDRDHAYAWSFAMPVVSTESYQPGEPTTPSANAKLKTTVRGQVASPSVKTLPIRSKAYDPDTRFEERAAAIPADAPGFPKGTPGLVVHALNENEEGHELFLPIRDGRLVAANRAGSPALSSRVFDLRPDNSLDPDRRAPLHSLVRVVRGIGLAWQQTGGGLDDAAGYGLVVGRPGNASTPQQNDPSAARPESSATTGTAGGGPTGTQIGGVTYINELEQKLRDEPLKPGNNGGVTVVGPTQTRPRSSRPAPAPSDTSKPPPPVNPPNATGLVGAYTSHERGGPIDVGGEEDPHFLGFSGDGEPLNSAHIHTEALFRASQDKDAGLDFDDKKPYEHGQPGAFNVPVTLRYDREVTHKWMGTEKLGRWRWAAKVPWTVIKEKDEERKPPPVPEPIGVIAHGPKTYPPGGGGTSGPTGVIGNGTPFTSTGGTTRGGRAVIDDGPPVALTPTDEQAWTAGCPKNGQAVTGGPSGTQVRDPCPTFPCLKVAGELVIGTRPTAAGLPDPTKGDPRCAKRTAILLAGAPDAVVITGYGTNPTGQPDGWDYTTKPTTANPGTSDGGGVALAPAGDTATVALEDGMSLGFGERNEDRTEAGVKDGAELVRDPENPHVLTWKGVDATGVYNGSEIEFDLGPGGAGLAIDGQPVGTGGGSAGALPGGTGADGDYDPADAASLATGLPNYDNFTLQAGRTIKGNAGQFHYVQVAGSAVLNGTINLDGRGNESGNGGAGGASSAAGNGTNGTARSVGAGTSAATAGGGARGGGSGSGDGATRSGGNGGTGGPGGNRGAPWSADGQGTGGAGTAGGTGAGSAGTLGGNATAVDPTLLARRVSHDFLVALLGGAGGGGGGGGGGYAAGTVVAPGGAGASTYADADGTGADGADGTFSVDSSGGGGGGKGGRGGGVYVMVVRGNVSGTFTINARGAQGGNGGVGNATGGDGGAGGGGGGGFVLIVFYGTWSATMTCNVAGGDSPAGQGAGEDGFYAVVNGSTGEVVQWGGSLAAIAERTSALVAVQPTVSAAPADPLVATAPTTLVPVDTSGGAFAVELPPADSVEVGDSVVLKDAGGAATANPLTVNANAADTIDGGASTSLGINSGALTIQKVAANAWMVT